MTVLELEKMREFHISTTIQELKHDYFADCQLALFRLDTGLMSEWSFYVSGGWDEFNADVSADLETCFQDGVLDLEDDSLPMLERPKKKSSQRWIRRCPITKGRYTMLCLF